MTTNTPAYLAVIVAVIAAVVSGGYLLVGVRSERNPDETHGSLRDSVVASPPISLRLPAGQAGVVEHDSGARIEVPRGATEEQTSVSIEEVQPPPSPLEVRRAFDFSVGGARLVGPVTVHIPFELELGQDASSVRAFRWNEEGSAWEPVPGLVDESAGTIAVATDRLALFSSLWVEYVVSPTAAVTVRRNGRPTIGADLRIERIHEQARPIYLGEENNILVEVRNAGDERSKRFNLIADFFSVSDGRLTRLHGVGPADGMDPGATATRSIYVRVPGDLRPGEYRVCARIVHPGPVGDPVDGGVCLDRYVLRRHEGAVKVMVSSTETDGGRAWVALPPDWEDEDLLREAVESTVSRDGVVTGRASGEAAITVRAGAYTTDAGPLQSSRSRPPSSAASTDATEQLAAGFTENFFGALDADRWLLHGSADHFQSEGTIQLTDARLNQLGFLLLKQPVDLRGFSIEFTFEIGGGTGADGLGLLLLPSMPDFSRINPAHHAGGGWGSRYFEGFVVAFDTHFNRAGRWSRGGPDFYHPVADPSGNFVALVELGAGGDVFDMTHLATRNLGLDLRDSGPFEAEVVFGADGNVKVYLANYESGLSRTLVIDHTIENFDPRYACIGFIGATGASTDRHVIRSVKYKPSIPDSTSR